MIALDTNVLIRVLVRDDDAQAESAMNLLEGLTPESPGFICREVVIEVVWVLERVYKFGQLEIGNAVFNLIATDSLVVEDTDDVNRAVSRYMQGGVDFSDLMILAASQRAGAIPLHTFDRGLARIEGAILIDSI